MENSIDSRILAYPDTVSDEEERGVARELRERKLIAKLGDRIAKATFKEGYKAYNKYKADMARIETLDIDELKNKIEDARFDGGTFYAILLLSAFKDAIDIFGLGIAGTIANFFIVPLLVIISLLRGTRLKGKLIRRYLLPEILETIPGIDTLPFYTLTTIILKIMADRKVKKLIARLEEKQKNQTV